VNRAEAVALYKEIMNLYKDMRASDVNLIKSKSNNPKATGYQVCIRAVLSNESAQQIRCIAEKLSLAVLEENGEVLKQINILL
jgi:hypothetical protein